jgi:hypothetical protein
MNKAEEQDTFKLGDSFGRLYDSVHQIIRPHKDGGSMRRLVVIFGIALMVFAFVILTIFIIAPAVVGSLDDAPLLKSIIQTAVCSSNEVLTASYSTYNTPTETTRSIYPSCVDKEQHARDVSQQIIQIGAIGYFGPFLIGLFMALLGRPGDKKQSYVPPAAAKSDFAGREADALKALMEAREQLKDKLANSDLSGRVHFQTQEQADHVPLAQRLRELKEAYSSGLVTEAEYNAKRKELLNES